jgi:FeS assembly SUF system protein
MQPAADERPRLEGDIMAAESMEGVENAPPVTSDATDATDATGATVATAAATGVEDDIVEALKTVFDPEIPVNIYEMGLIYDLNVEPDGRVQIKMTLTSPGCPVAGTLPGEVKDKVESVPGVAAAEVEVVWDPVWNPSMMSEAARLQLGMF